MPGGASTFVRGDFTVDSSVFCFLEAHLRLLRLIGNPRNTIASSVCQRKPTKTLSDTNARHSTLALRGKGGLIFAKAAALRISINTDGSPVAMGRKRSNHTRLARSSPPRLISFSSPPPSPLP